MSDLAEHRDFYGHGITIDVTTAEPLLLTAPTNRTAASQELASNLQRSVGRLATTTLPIYNGFSMTILNDRGQSCNARIANLSLVNGPHLVRDFVELYDVCYCLRSAFYHLDRLIFRYSGAAQQFAKTLPDGRLLEGSGSDESIYFEAEACITSAIRTVDALLKALWRFYGDGPVPKELINALKAGDFKNDLDSAFQQELLDWLGAEGQGLRDYRNCIMHCAPLQGGYCSHLFKPIIGVSVGVVIPLPLNPREKNRHLFEFGQGREMLSYSYDRCCEVLSIVEKVFGLEKIKEARINPPLPQRISPPGC